jgi:hypothetical protein
VTPPIRKTLAELRSRRWFAANDMRGFAHRQRMQQMGLRREDVLGKPIVAIVNTWSDLSPCHAHLRERAEAVKRGVLLAGGMPFELPAMSLGEVMVKPTTMLYRNFLAMEVEELLRSLPCDGAVLLAGCDKTTPGTVMGALSMGMPTCSAPPGRCSTTATGPAGGRRHAHPHVLGRLPGRHIMRRRMGAAGGAHDAQPRHLQHHGHRQHDDGHRRGAGPDAARQPPASRRWTPPTRAWPPTAANASSAWSGKT